VPKLKRGLYWLNPPEYALHEKPIMVLVFETPPGVRGNRWNYCAHNGVRPQSTSAPVSRIAKSRMEWIKDFEEDK
jgi:hypothetical protein